MDSLMQEESKQHLILMHKLGGDLALPPKDKDGHTHSFRAFLRDGSAMFSVFSPAEFATSTEGTALTTTIERDQKYSLTAKGRRFVDWLLKHHKDAETFESELGRWGINQTIEEWIARRGKA
jgi:hypothetical protein